MTKPRTPPVWLVMLPALALAAVGVRAVTAEMNASQDAARERAKSVASRLARSVDALVEEYAGALPEPRSRVADADAAISHLMPRAVFDGLPHSVLNDDGRVTTDSVSWAPIERDADPAALKLAQDALKSADRLAAEPRGTIAAAALLSATASAVTDECLSLPLRLAQARYEVRNDDRATAISTLEVGMDQFFKYRKNSTFDGVALPEAALLLAAELVDTSPPDWIREGFEFCARQPSRSDQATLARVERELGPRLDPASRRLRRLGLDAFELALTPNGDCTSIIKMRADEGQPAIAILRSVTSEKSNRPWTLLGGEIPREVVAERLVREAKALASEAGVAELRLVASDGSRALDVTSTPSPAREMVVASADLAGDLSSWRAEAVVAPESGVPATAWMLGAALVLTTAALLVGTLALRRAAERSARLAEERQTFLDHVAHELRTPAAAIQALTEELASGHVAAEREGVYRGHLLRESRRLSNLVEDTLDLTRLDAGRLVFKMEPADLRDVVRRAIEESDGAGRVVATLPDAPVVRPVDEGALRRAVKNLVENAVRHGGGDAPVGVALEASSGAASIVVTDHGRGIAAEHLPRLFERFYRVPSATHEVKGVGLGLALCREVARGHGGDVTVTSRVGKGSTFTMRLPL